MEPILVPRRPRELFAASERKHPELWTLYKQHLACFWTAEEIDLEPDVVHWHHRLTEPERRFVAHVLAFFASSDGIVIENLNLNFTEEVTLPEARAFYGIQTAMENVHSQSYSMLIDRYIADPDEKDDLFNAIATMPAVKAKADWAAQWMSRTSTFPMRLVAFACVEGVLFSGSFCAIFWLKKRGLMPSLALLNSLIARDEALHTEFACALYALLEVRLSDEAAHAIVQGAVEAERVFICGALSCDLVGMNREMMGQYIEFVADRLLATLGHAKVYGSENPFDWMELISMQSKGNFFEGRVTEYQRANVMTEGKGKGFALDVDF